MHTYTPTNSSLLTQFTPSVLFCEALQQVGETGCAQDMHILTERMTPRDMGQSETTGEPSWVSPIHRALSVDRWGSRYGWAIFRPHRLINNYDLWFSHVLCLPTPPTNGPVYLHADPTGVIFVIRVCVGISFFEKFLMK